MNWTLAIDHHHAALLRIVTMLYTAAGLAVGESVPTLKRHVRQSIVRFLRSAEAATRRLVYIYAETKTHTLPRPSGARAGASSSKRKQPRQEGPASGAGQGRESSKPRKPAFRLIDPRKAFPELHPDRRPRRKGPEPRIIGFWDGTTPLVEKWRIERERAAFAARHAPKPVPTPDDNVSSERLCRRLLALHTALNDLPGQAQRMARLLARRSQNSETPRLHPMRPGHPPGFRRRNIHPVDQVLKDMHGMAHRVRCANAAAVKPEPPPRVR